MNASPSPIGTRLPLLVRHVTQAMIDTYAKASGDFNPIHVDPDYASKGPFGRTIAHGLMTLAYVAQMLNEWTGGAFDECGGIDITFIAPVFADDTVEVSGVVESHVDQDGRPAVLIRLACKAGERQILAGTATQPMGNIEGA